ncbi:hypothetical protein CCP3SC15_1350005 [Gammaproteobacteria bacterium]
MKHRLAVVFSLTILSLLYGCISISNPGDKPDPVPPRLVLNENKVPTWDRPNAFGAVPDELKAKGDEVCKSAGAKEATGYHANALNLNGKPFQGGGFFCSGIVERCTDQNDKRDYCH